MGKEREETKPSESLAGLHQASSWYSGDILLIKCGENGAAPVIASSRHMQPALGHTGETKHPLLSSSPALMILSNPVSSWQLISSDGYVDFDGFLMIRNIWQINII